MDPQHIVPPNGFYKTRIIGISGEAGSGKDTAAKYLSEKYGFVQIALADKIKRICKDIFDFTDEQLWGESDARDEPDLRYPRQNSGILYYKNKSEKLFSNYLTSRHSLKELGTTFARNCYEDIWIDYALKTANKLLDYDQDIIPLTYDKKMGLINKDSNRPHIVIFSDIRFINEFELLKKNKGTAIRIKKKCGKSEDVKNHISEKEQKLIGDEMFDYIVENDSNMEDYLNKLDLIINNLKL